MAKMKQRIVSLAMALVMAFSLLPATALADEPVVECTKAEDCLAETHVEDCPKYVAPDENNDEDQNGDPEDQNAEVPEAVQVFPDAVKALEETEDSINACGAAYDALTEEEQARKDVKAAYEEFLAVAEAFNEPMLIPEEEKAIYVSDKGDDTKNGTTPENAVATLAEAVRIAPDGATIYVMSNLEMKTGARYWDKSLTITSLNPEKPVTVTRGAAMDMIDEDYHDPSRKGYIGSMLEVGGTASGSSNTSLTLENIIFDDGGPAETPVYFYMQQSTEGTGYFPIKETIKHEDGTKKTVITGYYIYNTANPSTGLSTVAAKADGSPYLDSVPEGWAPLTNRQIVHDAIIATYYGTAKITLGTGAVLQNFGGMSAVRLSGGELVMKAGSKIVDTTVTDRKKMAPIDSKTLTADYGPAGAIWVQGGTFTMNEGAEISNMVGRAVYVDGGSAEISGTIGNITADPQMWQGTNGVILHLRNSAEAILSRGGIIGANNTEEETNKSGYAIYVIQESKFLMEEGSVIQNLKSIAIFAEGATNEHVKVTINGEITGLITEKRHPIWLNHADVLIGKTGNIHHNSGGSYGTMYVQNTVDLDIYGKINDNQTEGKGGAFATPGHGDEKENGTTIDIWDYAEIKNNTCTGQGGAIHVKDCTVLTMHGGEISGNTANGLGGGIIFRCDGSGFSKVILEGGILKDNIQNASISNDLAIDNLTATGHYGNSNHYLVVSENVELGNEAIYFARNKKTVIADRNTKLGNASPDSTSSLTTASSKKGWDKPIDTIWTQRDSSTILTVGGLNLNSSLPVYVLTQKTGADGLPADGAGVKVYAATVEDGKVSFTIPTADVNDNGCAVAIVQPSENYGTLSITGPEQIKQTLTVEEYPVSYTVTYALSESMKSILANSISTPTYSLTLSPDANLKPVTVDTSSFNGTTITVDYTLPSAAFDTAEDIFSSALLTITLDDKSYVIPSNAAESQLIGLPIVTFDANGGAFAGGSTTSEVKTESGSSVTLPANPTRSGYTFTGWNTRRDGNGDSFNKSTVVTDSLTVYAQWSKDSNDHGDDTPIKDPEVPLAGDLQLNKDDHFAYIKGYADGTVRPNNFITRAQVATIFYRLMTKETRTMYFSESNDFSDVSDDYWANKAISTLSNAGIITGFYDGTFRPNAFITRAQFAAIAARFSVVTEDLPNPFSDVPEGYWAEDLIAFAADVGWVNGYADGTFRPTANITRAAAMKLINNVLERQVDEDGLLEDATQWNDCTPDDWCYYIVMEATNSHDWERRSKKSLVEDWTALTADPVWDE